MDHRPRRPLTVPALVALLALTSVPSARAADAPRPIAAAESRLARLPRLMLWAWERPERLDTLDPRTCGVAWLAATLTLRGDALEVRPRLQPLRVPESTVLVAVARLESDRRRPPTLDPAQRARVAEALVALARRPGLAGLQIDFDAARSQRPFYRALLGDVRRALPDTLALSMTALASWGLGDPWLEGLPVDEVVPMTFRMGADTYRVRAHLADGGDFAPALARAAVGCATDEPCPALASTRRLYLFHTRPWTPAALRTALARVQGAGTAILAPE